MYPRDTYEVLEHLERFHRTREDTYRQLLSSAVEARVSLLLERLIELEEEAGRAIAGEREPMEEGRTTYLLSGPTLTIKPAHAADCKCESSPSFDEALECALTSDTAVLELIDRLAGSSPAASVQELAGRLREFEQTRERQIAIFIRPD